MKKYTILLLASSLLSLGTTQAATQNITKCYGQSVTLKATQTGNSYQWYKDGTAISGETQNTYKVTNLEKSAVYTCEVTTNGTSTNTGNLITLGSFEFPANNPKSSEQNSLGHWISYEYLNFDRNGVNINIGACTTAKNANDVKTAHFSNLPPHSGSYLLVCDGASDPNARVWSARNLKLQGGVEYQFSCWAANIDVAYASHGANSLPKLKFVIENSTGTHTLLQFTAPTTLGKWEEYKATYTPPQDLDWCHIYIVNYTTEPAGNDFALDDVYFGTVINSAGSTTTDTFNVTVYDTFTYEFKTDEVCPGEQATITTTLKPAHGGTLEPASNYKYEWKVNGTAPVVSTQKDLVVTAPNTVGTLSYVLSTSSTVCYSSAANSETTSVKTKDCGVEKPISHPLQEACPGVEVELTCDTPITGAQSVKWDHDSSSAQSVKVNAGPNVGDKKDFKCTIVKIENGTTVTYIETFTVKTKDCTTEKTETHNLSDCPKQEVTLTCTNTADATKDAIVWSHDPSLQSTTTTVKTKDTPATPNTPDTYTCTITKVNDKGETFIYTETFNVTTKDDCVGNNEEEEKITIGSTITIKSDYWDTPGADFNWYKIENGVKTPVSGDINSPGTITFTANESVTYECITTLPNGYTYTETRKVEVFNDTEEEVYICYGDDFNRTANTQNASEYKWYNTLNETDVLSSTKELEIKELKQNTSYICKIIGADGITKITETYHVKLNPLPAFNIEVKVADATINISAGTAPYNISLSDGTEATSNTSEYTFEELAENTYIVTITDKNKCVNSNEFTISIPKLTPDIFFSPNNDGVNDLWLVEGIETAPNAYIRIYDRYSKLLYQCKGADFKGWDGNYNGHGMVQDDYWYVISIPETEEQISGHFTLKR
ncbi:MAG: T9SS type B sorting domain-containing protein [Paludibacteraceae bacterium]|nr:T9SS type B sorting domain-containing protein [Paludibacteraceae bacterium]